MDYKLESSKLNAALTNNTLTREAANDFIDLLIKYDYSNKLKKKEIIELHNNIYRDIKSLCDKGFRPTIHQFTKLKICSSLLCMYYSGKEMYDYCVANNKLLTGLDSIWYNFQNIPIEMIDFILNYNTTVDKKYNMICNMRLYNYTTEYVEKVFDFYEKNVPDKELQIYFNKNFNVFTYEQAKRYIMFKYRTGNMYSGYLFFDIIWQFKNRREELLDVLMEAIEYNHKNNKDKTYNIYKYVDNIIFYERIYYKLNYSDKILLKILPYLTFYSLKKHMKHYNNISSSDMHKSFMEGKFLPKMFMIGNIQKFFEKHKIERYQINEDIVNFDFLKEFHEELSNFFKDFDYNFPERYDKYLIENIKMFVIIFRQLIVLFNTLTEQKIDISKYVYIINDTYERLSDKLKNKYKNDFNEFYRLIAN